MIDSILKAAKKVKDEATEMCSNLSQKMETKDEIENYKSLAGKEFVVALPLYKTSAGSVYADDKKEKTYPARAMDRVSHIEKDSLVRVIHAGRSMLFVEEVN